MPGSVVAVHVEDGQTCRTVARRRRSRGDEDGTRAQGAHRRVVEVLVKVGDQVGVDQPLARLARRPAEDGNATEGDPHEPARRAAGRVHRSCQDRRDFAGTWSPRSPPTTTPSTPSRTRWWRAWPTWACSACRSPSSTAAWAATTSPSAWRLRSSAGSTRASPSRWRPACRSARCRSTGSGPRQQKQEWLPRLASGRALGAFGLTEAGAGSDAGGTRTTAGRLDGDDG